MPKPPASKVPGLVGSCQSLTCIVALLQMSEAIQDFKRNDESSSQELTVEGSAYTRMGAIVTVTKMSNAACAQAYNICFMC